ncbi:Exostosin-like [Sesbania bispinosa]|nr:Exostosin-like [Sesbania bispinosa]
MGNRRLLFLLGILAVNYLLFQSILVPYGNGNASWSSPPEKYALLLHDNVSFSSLHSTPKYFTVWNPLKGNASEISDSSASIAMVKKVHIPIIEDETGHRNWIKGMHNDAKSGLVSELGANRNDVHSVHEKKDVGKNDNLELESVGSRRSFIAILAKESNMDFSVKQFVETKNGTSTVSQLKNKYSASDNSTAGSMPRRKMRCEMPPKSRTLIQEMNHILVRHRASSRAMRPRWSSKLDLEILAARFEIEHAPIITHDKELYAPLFRNLSMFKRSYELMEHTLKVYIYKDGDKPIFHQPILKGLYASEGWFMKLMEENKHFVVKDPAKAHLFYMPFSSRRTGGADHFLVACHDWAPYETRHHMEHCIKALCIADVTQGFKIGRDVSLPETYVRSARNPQRDLGGKPPDQRPILAFYAGSMHGYLRPILLKHWKDRDPDMKIFGPMPPGVASKMNYIQHMKNSKYCICPKGYEVNSPRVVEAIFYECVPVIISDNFVPSFFEVLNWDAFSIILAEKDIPNLRQILLSVPEEKYLKLQLGVRRVQKHFLWHAKPLKYDLFHMTLHSIWYNRVFQIKGR